MYIYIVDTFGICVTIFEATLFWNKHFATIYGRQQDTTGSKKVLKVVRNI